MRFPWVDAPEYSHTDDFISHRSHKSHRSASPRPRLSASPSVFSRMAHASLRCVLREICEICVKLNHLCELFLVRLPCSSLGMHYCENIHCNRVGCLFSLFQRIVQPHHLHRSLISPIEMAQPVYLARVAESAFLHHTP